MHKKQLLPTCAGLALALLFWTNASARADIIWNYNWTPSTSQVNASSGGSGYLTLTNEPGGTTTNSSNTIVTNIQAVSTAPSSNPAVFNNVPVSFALQLQDSASTATDTLTFSGTFSGSITSSSSNVQLSFSSPTTETVTLGGNQYQVQVGTYSPPGPPSETNSGSLNAFVTVTPLSGAVPPVGVASVPEPTAMTLAFLAFPFAGLCGWRRRRLGI